MAELEFLEPMDVAHDTGESVSNVRYFALTGRLRVAARTRSGGRLFKAGDVAAFKRWRMGKKETESRKGIRSKQTAGGRKAPRS